MSFLYSSTRNDMLQCFVCSPIPKVSEKKGATSQSFILKEITTCRIGAFVNWFWEIRANQQNLFPKANY